MTQTYTEDVLIDGSQDTEQLRVQGHSTQTEPLQVWEDSSGDELAQVTGDGRFQVGSFTGGAMATDDALIEVHRDEADTAKPTRGLHLLGEITGTLSAVVAWTVQELVLQGTGGISALHSALRVKLTNQNTGDADTGELRAGDFEVVNEGGSSGQPVGEVMGMRVALSNETTGYLETGYGLKIEVENAGTVNDVYAIHTGNGVVHLGDVVELAEQTSAVSTPDSGLMRLYPKDDGKLYAQNDAGDEFDLLAGAGIPNPISAALSMTANHDYLWIGAVELTQQIEGDGAIYVQPL